MTAAEFATAYTQQLQYVWHTLRRLGVAPPELDDLTQEVFITAFQRIDSYDDQRPLRPWLFGIAFRVASARRQRAVQRHEVSDTATPEVSDAAPSPQRSLEATQKLARVQAALDTLRLERKVVFILHDIEGLAMPEVARTLSIPLNTAYTRLRLARADFTEAWRRNPENTR